MFLFHDANKIACLNKGRLSAALASTTLGQLRQQCLLQKKPKGKEKEPLSRYIHVSMFVFQKKYIYLNIQTHIYIYIRTYFYICKCFLIFSKSNSLWCIYIHR